MVVLLVVLHNVHDKGLCQQCLWSHDHHPFNSTYSNINRHQPPQYEQSSTCPKNVFGPPAFPSLALGTLRVQERPLGIHNFKCNPFYRPMPWEKHLLQPSDRIKAFICISSILITSHSNPDDAELALLRSSLIAEFGRCLFMVCLITIHLIQHIAI
jgi:hypothetical protein